jgi:hypothetical protein
VTRQEIMSDFDEDKYVKAYCYKRKCHECDGTSITGEPNGDGCEGLSKRINTMYHSILTRRLKKLGFANEDCDY